MKKILYFFAASLGCLAVTGCSDSMDDHSGEGRLMLRAQVSPEIRLSRAFSNEEMQRLNETCLIWISGADGPIRKFTGVHSLPSDGIWLQSGSYLAESWAGDSVPASFTERYFKGVKQFTIEKGVTNQIDLKSTLANTAVSVRYDDSVDDVLTDYKLTVGHSCGSLEWVGKDERSGYFMMNSRDKDLNYTLTGKDERGNDLEKKGVIEAVRPGTEYVIKISYEEVGVQTGGAYFNIEIDENLLVIENDITIMSAPQVTGVYQSLDEPYYGEKGSMERQGFFVTATADLTSVVVKVDGMDDILAATGANNFDILYIHDSGNEELHTTLEGLGIKHILVRSEDSGDDMKITFEPELLNRLGEGIYRITIEATDKNKKTGVGSLDIIITDAVVDSKPVAPEAPTTWATRATLSGTVMKANAENVGFNYRVKGETDWQFAEAISASRAGVWNKGDEYSVILTNLIPGTTYEYVAASTGFVSTTIREFTTEAAAQLPNCDFEDWWMDGKVQRIMAQGSQMFWDSGNKGSSTAGTTLTTPCESPRHGGNYSAKLASEKVAIAFAAGNLFVGEFLGTESLTKGILGWGRPWATRPKALKGYVKYTPQPISDVNGSPAGITINKGDMDTGIIYIAIVDDSKMTYGSYSGWPQIVATKNIDTYGFKSTDSKVIAYGEKVFTEATPGDGLVEFEIPLDYHRTDVKASNIIVVASASRYGDYYTGGPSVMYLDDFELVY